MSGFEIDETPADGGNRRAFHIVVRAPQEAADHRALVRRIVDVEKPAYVTYDLQFAAAAPAPAGRATG